MLVLVQGDDLGIKAPAAAFARLAVGLSGQGVDFLLERFADFVEELLGVGVEVGVHVRTVLDLRSMSLCARSAVSPIRRITSEARGVAG